MVHARPISLNSPCHCPPCGPLREEIMGDVRDALNASGSDSDLCFLELTETTLMHNVEDTVGQLIPLEPLGGRLLGDSVLNSTVIPSLPRPV
jgi:hypothetical protein